MVHPVFYPVISDDDYVLEEEALKGGRQHIIEINDVPVGLITPGSLSWDLKEGYSSIRNPADYFELYLDLEIEYQVRHETYQRAVDEARKVIKEYQNPQLKLF